MSAKDYFGDDGPFRKRLREVKKRDPESIQFEEERQHHRDECVRLYGEVEQLEKQKNEAKDEEGRKELEQQVKLKTLERDLAWSKWNKAVYQQAQRSSELEKEMLLEEQKTATSDDMKREIQRLLETAEGKIREWKEEVNKYQSEAKSHEESLGLLVKEEIEKVRDDALKRGYVLLQLFTSLMVGTSGVGKTLLKYLLLGKDPPLLRCSTACAEKPVRIRSVTLSKFKKRFGKWFDINAEKLLPMIGRYIRKNVEQLKKIIPEEMKGLLEQLEMSAATPPAENVSSATTSEVDSTTPVVAEASASQPSDVEPISQEEEAALKEMIDSVFGKLEKLISGEELSDEEAEELFCSIWVYFTDSGGQPQFHELLPLFIHNISSVIFVSRLSDRLDDRPPDEYYVEGVPLGKRSCTHLTTTEQVQCLTRSLLSRDSNSSKPPVIIMVGTHRDLMSKCSETIDEKNAKLIKMFGPELKKHLVFYKPSTKLLFPVNCLHPEIEDEEVARLIQQAVESAVVKKLEVPLWWFVLELLLQGLASKLNKRVLSRRFCVCVANALGFTEKSFDAALSYFNELNIMKYSKALPHLVFVDSQVPLDNVSDLVEEGYLLRHGEGSTRQGDGKQFCDEGIVTVEYLNSTCKHFEKPLFEAPQLLTLLENQLAAVPLVLSPVVKHFMPTLLDILSLEDLEKQRVLSFEVAVPLLFRFSHGCRRAGVFCCLIVYLMKECAWKIHNKDGDLMLVARNCVTFSLSSCTCIVTLIDAFYFIEAHITQATPSVCVKACPMIRKAVIDGINAACVSLRYENDHPHLAFFCEHPGTTGAASPPSYEARHAAAVVKEDDCCICTEGKAVSELQENQTIWLNEPAAATTCQGGAPQQSDVQLPKGEVQPQKVVKSGQITSSDRLFNDIAVELCEKYYEVGLELGLQGKVLTNELETGKFTMQQGSKKALKMLQLWRDNVDKDKCTYSVLAAALEKRGFQRCADEYCYTRSTRIGPVTSKHLFLIKWKDEQEKTQRFHLLQNISHKWRTIGELLDLSSRLESLAMEHGDKPEDCCQAVMRLWLANPPDDYPCTWSGLIELLEDSQLDQIASQLRNVLHKANL